MKKVGLIYKKPLIRKYQTGGTTFNDLTGTIATSFGGYANNISNNITNNGLFGGRRRAREARLGEFDSNQKTNQALNTSAVPSYSKQFDNMGSGTGAGTSSFVNKYAPKTDFMTKNAPAPSFGSMSKTAPTIKAPDVASAVAAPNALQDAGVRGLERANVAGIKPPSGGFSGLSGGAAAGIGAAGSLAGGLLQGIDDNKNYKYSGKEKAGTIGGSILSGAAAGAAAGFNPISIGIGAAVGLITGLIKNKKKKKEAAGHLKVKTAKEKAVAENITRSEVLNRDRLLSSAPTTTAQTPRPYSSGYGVRSRKTGGSFSPITFSVSDAPNSIKYQAPPELTPKKFKRGGTIKPTENIIPNGVLHEEFNDLGDKGMPVVKCKDNSCEKKYEIEKDEMIFTLDATKKVEDLAKKGDFDYLGSFVKTQILNNTHSFTPKFDDLNKYTPKDETIFAQN